MRSESNTTCFVAFRSHTGNMADNDGMAAARERISNERTERTGFLGRTPYELNERICFFGELQWSARSGRCPEGIVPEGRGELELRLQPMFERPSYRLPSCSQMK